ncbi:hypothetical protein [Bremerella sp.]|uniref:hypothetical protein n=1 Tax=Bremerella sp. TaxID=2795602 RepID=UPI00391979E4
MRVVGVALLIYFGFSAMGDVKYIVMEYGETTSDDIAGTAGRLTVNLILTFIGAVLAMNKWGKDAKEVETSGELPKPDDDTPGKEEALTADVVAASDPLQEKT